MLKLRTGIRMVIRDEVKFVLVMVVNIAFNSDNWLIYTMLQISFLLISMLMLIFVMNKKRGGVRLICNNIRLLYLV